MAVPTPWTSATGARYLPAFPNAGFSAQPGGESPFARRARPSRVAAPWGQTPWGPRVVNPPPPRASGPRTPQLSPSCRASLSSAVVGARRSAPSSPSLRAPASWAVLGLRAASVCSALSGGALHRFLRRPSVHSQADHRSSLSSLLIAPKNTEAAAKEGPCGPPRVWAKAGRGRRRFVSAMRIQAPASSRVCRSREAHPSVPRAAYRTWCCPCCQETPRACGTLTGADKVLGRRPAAGKPVRFHGADASSRRGSRSCFFLRVLFRGLEGASSPCHRGTQQRVKRPGLVERLWSDEAPSTSLPPSPPLSRGTWEFTRLHEGSAC